MQYIRTTVGRDFPPSTTPPALRKLLRVLLFFVPVANPDNDPKLHLVKQWLIEFDESGGPRREIGGPDRRRR